MRVSGEEKIVNIFLLTSSYILLPTGVVTSPNHPNNYTNNFAKTETIQVEQGLILLLQFTAFDIEFHESTFESPCDYYDHLKITDGDGTTLMEKSCGSSLPADITSTSNIVKLVFITDGSNTRTGWSVRWRAVTRGECQQNVWIVHDFPDNFSTSKNLFTRFDLSFPKSSHCWPTLQSAPWCNGLPLREPH